jgi:glucose-6-phosphate isomerase
MIWQHHFYAVSENRVNAKAFGFLEENIFPLWSWVGGRFSLWSAIGLPIMFAIGRDHFMELLAGAHAMDKHVQQCELRDNLAVLLALNSIWYRNFFHSKAHAVIPYSYGLRDLPRYLQQLIMESNGKQVTKTGQPIDYDTSPVIWGEQATNSQHSFHQYLHQGTDLLPIDFIVMEQAIYSEDQAQHQQLLVNCFAQMEALLMGQNTDNPHYDMPGSRPSTLIRLPKLSPYYLGALLALYEHQVFIQGCLWGINSFDQCGVELGKKLAKKMLKNWE